MKKYVLALIVLLVAITLGACGEKVMLHCDAEDCTNTIAADEGMDESWVVFCESCSDKIKVD